MNISVAELKSQDSNELIDFLSSEEWSFHSTPVITKEKIQAQIGNGYFTGSGKRTFLIRDNEKLIGVIRLFDLGDDKLDDETPLFDIKITNEYRSKGVGEKALHWLTELVFTEYPSKNRFEATTRVDNIAMRRVFEKCGFVKEAHYRQAWPDSDGKLYDCTGYSILRQDWQNKTKTPVKFES
jgi:RimJ/RimL family protein N-acetyltransferase